MNKANSLIALFKQTTNKITLEQSRQVILFVLINLLLIVGITSRQGNILLLSIPLVILWGMSLILSIPEIQIKVNWNRDIYRIYKDQSAIVRCSFTNLGLPLEQVKIKINLPIGLDVIKGDTSIISSFTRDGRIDLKFEVKGRCGTYELEGIELVVSGFLGLNYRKEILKIPSQVIVLPLPSSKKGLVLRPHRVKNQTGINLSKKGGEGIEVFGIREYKPGDPLRYVNARASARHPSAFFIQEFEREKAANVLLLVDTFGQSQLNNNNQSLQHILEAAALLNETLLNSGNKVGLFVFGKYNNWVVPGSGILHKERVLRSLAFKEGNKEEWDTKLTKLPSKLLTPRSVIIMISPLLGTDLQLLYALKGYRHQVLVVSPNEVQHNSELPEIGQPIRMALRAARIERQLVIDQLNSFSIPVLDWHPSQSFEPLVSQFLGRYWA